MNSYNDFESTLKKYAKPQLLTMEKTIKQGLALACITYLICLIGNFSEYLTGDINDLGAFFASTFAPTFLVFVLYSAIVGSIRCYKIQREQILADDTPPAESAGASVSKVGEGPALLSEINTLKRTVETLAIEVALLQQQLKTLNNSHWQTDATKK